MPSVELERRYVTKPWGRDDIDPLWGWQGGKGDRLGEIWFVDREPGDAPLLLKYLFTSERLSIQVHPDDAAARRRGLTHGKDEAWLVVAADDGATIGLGLERSLDAASLRAAAVDGSLEALMDWRSVVAGDLIYSPGGTIHAIGPGLCLLEIQQNLDLTYRLYDYDRPRELHVDEAVAVAAARPYAPPALVEPNGQGRSRLAGPAFTVELWSGASGLVDREAWVAPVRGETRLDGQRLAPGSVWRSRDECRLETEDDGLLVLAYAG